jgi:hypothetical protein
MEAGALATSLRSAGATVAELGPVDEPGALAFAQAWRYDAAVVVGRKDARAVRASDRSTMKVNLHSEGALEGLLAWARAGRTPTREDG